MSIETGIEEVGQRGLLDLEDGHGVHLDLSEYERFGLDEWIGRFRESIGYKCDLEGVGPEWRTYYSETIH